MGYNPYISGRGGEADCAYMHISSTLPHRKDIKGVCSISKPAHKLPTNGMQGTGAATPVNIFGYIWHKYY